MIRSTLAGLAGGLTWLVSMQLFFGPAQRILADPARQSPKMLSAFGLDDPAPRMYTNPWLVPVALCAIAIVWGWLYGGLRGWIRRQIPSSPGGSAWPWWRNGLAFGGVAWIFMVPWFEFYLPYNVLREPLPLVGLELVCWLGVLLSVGLAIAGAHAVPLRRARR